MAFYPRWGYERRRQDRSGKRWNFCYWYSGPAKDGSVESQRLFFWDDAKQVRGVLLFLPGSTVCYSRITNLIDDLTAKSAMREAHTAVLSFPLEKHYGDFGDLQAEADFLSSRVSA